MSASRAVTLFGWVGVVAGLGLLGPALSACNTEAYCFANCDDGSSSTGVDASAGSGEGGHHGFVSGSDVSASGTGGTGPCMPTNGGIEICDHLDNDCNGQVDDIDGIDFESPESCGTCDNNCFTSLLNVDPTTITCTPSSNPGVDPGQCAGTCEPDYSDLDHDGSCEYYCIKTTDDDHLCNAKDDNCNGQIDEDVDVCTSTTDCGYCGNNCVVVNGTAACVNSGAMPCNQSNTKCQIATCDPGWVDLDQSYATGCEYPCTPTNGGIEICGDGIDNDCDGKIDSADDLSLDTVIGSPCFGGTSGECATAAHQGAYQCIGNQVVCTGANVLHPGEHIESCNNLDDDCDGVVDNNPSDAGSACGVSNIFPCQFGHNVCQSGALVCVGAVSPGTETCNGQDDNCDGQIDLAGGFPPADAVGTCNVPPPPPPGATTPCHAGSKACIGGTVQCQGSVVATTSTDTCGVDANCNGVLENQPNKMIDTANCGTCGNDCMAGSVHANWSCMAGSCHFDGCQPGFYDLNSDQQCEYACNFVQAQEICNGSDDNCNGVIDEGVIAPSPTSVCGVSPLASTPECTTGVNVQCVSGAWQCTFPSGVCSPTCATATEVCDGLDNDCDGFVNENVPNYGQPCASDDAAPTPGDGACRTVGTRVCNGANAIECSAVKANCATLPGGCTELCDGIDNDCDGLIDEPYTAKGTNAANFYKPNVVKVDTSLWMDAYEVSRPKATATTPGSGNGYFTSAPAGSTLDKTPACSESGKIPWFNVTPDEVEQTCNAMGGVVCSTAEWQNACRVTPAVGADCTFGYAPYGAACRSAFTAGTKFCNLGPTYDFLPAVAGDQDGLLPTHSSLLQNCDAEWTGLLANPATSDKIFDITGNLREVVKDTATTYKLMGGAFNSGSEDGAACNFTFYTVANTFKFYDTGYRCCYDFDPRL